MSFETGAPPPPDHPEVKVVHVEAHDIAPARPARQYDATSVIAGLGGPPPGTTTYRLRGIETTEAD